MGHAVSYVVWMEGERFNELLDAETRSSPSRLRELEASESLADGRIAGSDVEFSVELSGAVTLIFLPIRHSLFESRPEARATVLAFEEALRRRARGHRIVRTDELHLEEWGELAGDEWFRSRERANDFLRWLQERGAEGWEEILPGS